MVNLLQIKLWEVLQKTGRKNVSKIVKDKTPVKLQPDTLLSKPLCTADPEISGCFLIQILLLWYLICVYVEKHKDV